MRRIAVLISNTGTGSNLQALIDAATEGYDGQLVCVVSDKANAYGLVRAREADIPTELFDYGEYQRRGLPRSRYEEDLARKLQTYSPDVIILAGWMLAFSKTFLKYFPSRVLSLHPGLLPDPGKDKFRLPDSSFADPFTGLSGANAIQAVLASGQTYAGSTFYLVTERIDQGPVLERAIVKVEPNDTVDSLYTRLKGQEHEMLVTTLAELCKQRTVAR